MIARSAALISGVCERKDPLRPLVITQYYEKGSVLQMLARAKSWLDLAPPARKEEALRELHHLSWAGRLKMLHDVAAAMMHVHSQGVLHGDLRSPNLFVDSHGKLVVADFGFGEILPKDVKDVSPKRTTNPRWVAPEALHPKHPRISKASDVYSFAIIMYEMLTWSMPYHNIATATLIVTKQMKDLGGVRVTPEVPQLPPDEQLPLAPCGPHLEQYKQLMTACWDPDPSKRPTFRRVTALLEKQQQAVAETEPARVVRPLFGGWTPFLADVTGQVVAAIHEENGGGAPTAARPSGPEAAAAAPTGVTAATVAAAAAAVSEVPGAGDELGEAVSAPGGPFARAHLCGSFSSAAAKLVEAAALPVAPAHEPVDAATALAFTGASDSGPFAALVADFGVACLDSEDTSQPRCAAPSSMDGGDFNPFAAMQLGCILGSDPSGPHSPPGAIDRGLAASSSGEAVNPVKAAAARAAAAAAPRPPFAECESAAALTLAGQRPHPEAARSAATAASVAVAAVEEEASETPMSTMAQSIGWRHDRAQEELEVLLRRLNPSAAQTQPPPAAGAAGTGGAAACPPLPEGELPHWPEPNSGGSRPLTGSPSSAPSPQVVWSRGVCQRPPLVVTEYFSNGSLYTLLQKAHMQLISKNSSQKHVKWLSWRWRLEMLHQVAGGMM
ncbi:hypothetical protein MNEG_12620 [Monoraphidium neglectum]|uniref:Protein kinase domain-containing protein n=1 Tax=Monoraphidium neglectum TaxID=145388 RepID=A0A0D2J630_9CHLO|nr:hypothetical protein MNEG_12620 [Monoraphidium neglectum]KIY95342.1 hypothetical protein MNEG_12620 [Monoraphidium neglectum]|eukprot:XP_013894362.1 hypothetical protein MNEG_12620 [Monoraphidium neglectum]